MTLLACNRVDLRTIVIADAHILAIRFQSRGFRSEKYVMLPSRILARVFHCLILGFALLAGPVGAIAQRHGGSSSSVGQGGLNTYSRPDGVDEKDNLEDFHHVLAVQATSQQIAEFQLMVKATDATESELQTFVERLPKEKSASAESGAALNQAWQSARSKNQHFEEGFSAAQKDGLKELVKRLDKAESDVEQERTKLDQSLRAGSPQDVSSRGDSLGKALTEFSNEQLALGREMSIVVANAQDLSFNLHAVKTSVTIEGRTVGITVSGALTQIEEQPIDQKNAQRTFHLELDEDLSDLQQNIGDFLNAELSNVNPCGERLAVRQAMLTPSAPSSLLVLRLHYERWSCIRQFGQTSSNELAESDGTVEIKLTPVVGQTNTLKINSEFGHIDASGMFADSLRSGDLGDDLRDKVSTCILAALRAGTDFKTTLPPALENSAAIQSAQFRDAGAGVLNVVLEGKTQISNEQVNLLASQLNQAMSDKAATPQ
jgi:hypothetical protein